ncbi:MAG: acyltransferase [Anaerolineae bacterium]|nr:acyltransferase [Anaerolineae bacterium]
MVMRILGFNIGKGVSFWGLPTLIGGGKLHQKLIIGRRSLFNVECFLDLAGPITIGKHVVLGPQVMLITGAHKINGPDFRSGTLLPQPIKIDDGAWLGARCTILPNVTIGAGAVVAAGAVVTKDVAPNTLVGGAPARVIRLFETEVIEATEREETITNQDVY